jgi:hypothetical protein
MQSSSEHFNLAGSLTICFDRNNMSSVPAAFWRHSHMCICNDRNDNESVVNSKAENFEWHLPLIVSKQVTCRKLLLVFLLMRHFCCECLAGVTFFLCTVCC